MTRTVEEHLESALDFLRALNPWDGIFPADYRRAFIFRGVGSASYRLIPSAFREGTSLRQFEGTVTAPLPTVGSQIRAELSTLWEFFCSADRQGLRLPEDSQDLREILKLDASIADDFLKDIELGRRAWPPNHLISLMALAQHYGVPTRLLDWTWNPYIAAYFAASNSRGVESNICVWAFATVHSEIQELLTNPAQRKLHLVSAPASDNENLRAQRWVGLLFRHVGVSAEVPFTQPAYDEIAVQTYGSDAVFYKLTLPAQESGELLRLLSLLDIDGAALFPGFQGAAKVVNEMARWPDQESWRKSNRLAMYWSAQVGFYKKHELFGLTREGSQ